VRSVIISTCVRKGFVKSVLTSLYPSARLSAGNSSALTGRIFVRSDVRDLKFKGPYILNICQ
jgi:hypothetical protein